MKHRHLTHEAFTLAAIDDVIARGKRADWAELRRAMLADEAVREGVLKVSRAYVVDPMRSAIIFGSHYAEQGRHPS